MAQKLRLTMAVAGPGAEGSHGPRGRGQKALDTLL